MADTSLLDSPFVRLLAREANRKPNYPIFEMSYEEARANLKNGGTVTFEGMTLEVPTGVYPPRTGSSTEFVTRSWWAAHLDKGTGTLLELGCGSGALTLYAACRGWTCIGADIDEAAVAGARRNAVTNQITATFVQSDLFAAFADQCFDVILFNQPYFHKPVVEIDERPLADQDGQLTKRMFDEAARHLNPGGKLVFTYSNCSNERLLERSDWTFKLAACDYESRGHYWRTMLVGSPR